MKKTLFGLLVLGLLGGSAWGGHNAAAPDAASAHKAGHDTLRYLRKLAQGRPLGRPVPSPVPGIQQVELDADTVYVTDDGRYAFVGSLIDLQQGRNLTAQAKAHIARRLLDAFGDENKVIFPAQGEQKAVIDVFTDTSCPYCRKLHAELPKLLKAGVTVRYIPYPRGGKRGPGYQGLRQVWCAKDPLKAMDDAKHGKELADKADCPRAALVDKGYLLGDKLGLRGTPTIYLPDGTSIGGYMPARELLLRIFH